MEPNETMTTVSNTLSLSSTSIFVPHGPHPLSVRDVIIIVAFVVGCVGNTAALWILRGRPSTTAPPAKSQPLICDGVERAPQQSGGSNVRSRNPRHVLLLRCLAANDLLAELGMLSTMCVSRWFGSASAHDQQPYWTCALYVAVRVFGLGSGCVALVMAAERWLALTRPFFYQQYITYEVLKRAVFCLWSGALILTYAPLLGFGQFYSEGKCCRYREATRTPDVIYAYIFLTFGTTLCLCIVCCNSMVFCALARLGSNRADKRRVLIRRVSRSIITNTSCQTAGGKFSAKRQYAVTYAATSEELAFARLMAFLCLIFVTCWLPQMIAIPLAQFFPSTQLYRIVSRLADMLMCVYFTLDPFVYVLYQYFTVVRRSVRRRSDNSFPHAQQPPTTEPQARAEHQTAWWRCCLRNRNANSDASSTERVAHAYKRQTSATSTATARSTSGDSSATTVTMLSTSTARHAVLSEHYDKSARRLYSVQSIEGVAAAHYDDTNLDCAHNQCDLEIV